MFALQCQDLYRLLVKESYEEYRHLRYQMTTVRHLGPDVTDGTQCPVCPQVCCVKLWMFI